VLGLSDYNQLKSFCVKSFSVVFTVLEKEKICLNEHSQKPFYSATGDNVQ